MKSCFVIAPIGVHGSDVRKRSDQVMKHVISPIVGSVGYAKPVRADHISEPGSITSQIINHLIEDDLVIADLTGHYPNVFYELAVRHVVRKPYIQIIKLGEILPFDIANLRSIPLDIQDPDSIESCKEELQKQLHAIESNPKVVDSPITAAIDQGVLRQSENPLEKSTAEILSIVEDIRSKVYELEVQSLPSATIFSLIDKIESASTLAGFDEESGPPSNEDCKQIQATLEQVVDSLRDAALRQAGGLPTTSLMGLNAWNPLSPVRRKGRRF